MGTPDQGTLSKSLGRFTKLRLLVLALIVTTFVLCFAFLPSESKIGTISRIPPKLQQLYVNSKAGVIGALKGESTVSQTMTSLQISQQRGLINLLLPLARFRLLMAWTDTDVIYRGTAHQMRTLIPTGLRLKMVPFQTLESTRRSIQICLQLTSMDMSRYTRTFCAFG